MPVYEASATGTMADRLNDTPGGNMNSYSSVAQGNLDHSGHMGLMYQDEEYSTTTIDSCWLPNPAFGSEPTNSGLQHEPELALFSWPDAALPCSDNQCNAGGKCSSPNCTLASCCGRDCNEPECDNGSCPGSYPHRGPPCYTDHGTDSPLDPGSPVDCNDPLCPDPLEHSQIQGAFSVSQPYPAIGAVAVAHHDASGQDTCTF